MFIFLKIAMVIFGLYLLFFILNKLVNHREHYSKEQFIIGTTSALMFTGGLEYFLILFIVIKYKYRA